MLPSRINTGISSLSQSSSISPVSPSTSKKGHSRQASLGTTMTSPSNRRRSMESTMSLIQGVLEGKPARIEEHEDMNGLTDKLAGSSVGKNVNPGPSRSSAPARWKKALFFGTAFLLNSPEKKFGFCFVLSFFFFTIRFSNFVTW